MRLALVFTLAVSIFLLFGLSILYSSITRIYETSRQTTIATEMKGTIDETQDHLRDDLAIWLEHGFLFYSVAGLFEPDGAPIAGNLKAIPSGMVLDGKVREIDLPARIIKPSEAPLPPPRVLGAGVRRADGTILILGRSLDEVSALKSTVLDLFFGATLVTLLLSLSAGLWLSIRNSRRLRAILETIGRVMKGELNKRLPITGSHDDLDRLAFGVNQMLDMIERLLIEVKAVGDNIAHDLRTPLSVVRSQLDRAVSSSSNEESLRQTAEKALVGLDRALLTITALLRLAEIENGRRWANFCMLDFAIICAEASEFYLPLAEDKGVSLALDIESSLPILGDRELLFEAVANLLDNAIKFTPRGGHVTVSGHVNDEALEISVSDSGPGIPKQERSQIGKRFYRADKSRKTPGTGLGLSITQAIADLHGLRLTASNNRDQGTILSLTASTETSMA